MIDFEFRIGKSENVHTHLDIELFYVLEGRVDFTIEEKVYTMVAEDFLIVNSGRRHAYEGSPDALAGCFHIAYDELARLLKQSMVLFWCNSTAEDGELYEEVREIIQKIINQHYYHDGEDLIYLHSLHYELLHVLQNNFLLTEEDSRYRGEQHKFDDRKHKIAEYIRQNYDKPIVLSDLARELYLSTAYLSKYIKKQFGMSFLEYVNSIRLGYAISELLYSDKPVVRIAMDTGFANSAAFNKAFKEKYNTTPSVYRSQWQGEPSGASKNVRAEKKLKKKVDSYFAKHRNGPVRPLNVQDITLNHSQGQPLNYHWQEMINGGAAADLLRSDMQDHLRQLRERLHFKYVRFWDIYAPEMFLDRAAGEGYSLAADGTGGKDETAYNFSRLDMILDFLTRSGMKPYMELGMKPKKLLRSRQSVLLSGRSGDGIFAEDWKIRSFMKALMEHLIDRYGMAEVEQWYFELWMKEDEDLFFRKDIPGSEGMMKKYFHWFDVTAKTLRTLLPGVRIGGGGLYLRHGKERFLELLGYWKEFEQQPDFMTFYCYSYPAEMDTTDKVRNQSLDKNYMKSFLRDVRQLMVSAGYADIPVHVTEWNFTVSNRNVFNDSCQKGAYVMKNIIDSVGMADVLGYWCASDIFSEFYDSDQFICGGSGLLTRNGICKPAYYAMEFLCHAGHLLYERGDNYMITGDGKEYWYVLCHNYKHFNYQYGLRAEDDVHVDEQKHLLTDVRKLRMRFTLPLLPAAGGAGLVPLEIKTYAVNEHNGSIQDNWLKAGLPGFLHAEDLKYLRSASVPAVRVHYQESEDGRVCFETTLEANEIQWIRIKVGQNNA